MFYRYLYIGHILLCIQSKFFFAEKKNDLMNKFIIDVITDNNGFVCLKDGHWPHPADCEK